MRESIKTAGSPTGDFTGAAALSEQIGGSADNAESAESRESAEEYISDGGSEIFGTSAPPPLPRDREIRFFTDPKTVKKKTEGEIIAFQVAFTALFCLAYKLTELFSPELYMNISAYLERLFGW